MLQTFTEPRYPLLKRGLSREKEIIIEGELQWGLPYTVSKCETLSSTPHETEGLLPSFIQLYAVSYFFSLMQVCSILVATNYFLPFCVSIKSQTITHSVLILAVSWYAPGMVLFAFCNYSFVSYISNNPTDTKILSDFQRKYSLCSSYLHVVVMASAVNNLLYYTMLFSPL